MSNTPRKRAKAAPADVEQLPDPSTLPVVPAPDELTFDQMWLIKAATGVDVLDPPIRGLAIAACLWFACRDLEPALTWEQARKYNVSQIELGGEGLDESLDRDPETGDPTGEAAADPTSGSETPSSE